MTCRSGPEQTDEADDQLDHVVEIEAAVLQRHVAGVDPIGQVDVVVGQHGLDRAAQQRREMPRQRRDHQQFRFGVTVRLGGGLAETASAGRTGVAATASSVTATSSPVDRHPLDAEFRPLVRDAGCGKHAQRRRGAARDRRYRRSQGWLSRSTGGLGHQPHRRQAHRIVLDRLDKALSLMARAAATEKRCGTTEIDNTLKTLALFRSLAPRGQCSHAATTERGDGSTIPASICR